MPVEFAWPKQTIFAQECNATMSGHPIESRLRAQDVTGSHRCERSMLAMFPRQCPPTGTGPTLLHRGMKSAIVHKAGKGRRCPLEVIFAERGQRDVRPIRDIGRFRPGHMLVGFHGEDRVGQSVRKIVCRIQWLAVRWKRCAWSDESLPGRFATALERHGAAIVVSHFLDQGEIARASHA